MEAELTAGKFEFEDYDYFLNQGKVRKIELYYGSVLCGMILYDSHDKEIKKLGMIRDNF